MNHERKTKNQAPSSSNIVWHEGHVDSNDRARVLGQQGCVLWFTGLSGSGKSTIARALEQTLLNAGHAAYVLDGDNVRHGLNADLGFTPDDRKENIRRLSHLAALFADAGMITITAFISPYREDRNRARAIIDADINKTTSAAADSPPPQPPTPRFFEVYVNTPLDVCESRDPKNLYAKARAGEIPNFTGISAPFEPPSQAEIELLTHTQSVNACVKYILETLQNAGILVSEHA